MIFCKKKKERIYTIRFTLNGVKKTHEIQAESLDKAITKTKFVYGNEIRLFAVNKK